MGLKKVYHTTTNDIFNNSCPFLVIFGTNITGWISIKRWCNFPHVRTLPWKNHHESWILLHIAGIANDRKLNVTLITRKIVLCLTALFYLFIIQFLAWEEQFCCIIELKQHLVDIWLSAPERIDASKNKIIWQKACTNKILNTYYAFFMKLEK